MRCGTRRFYHEGPRLQRQAAEPRLHYRLRLPDHGQGPGLPRARPQEHHAQGGRFPLSRWRRAAGPLQRQRVRAVHGGGLLRGVQGDGHRGPVLRQLALATALHALQRQAVPLHGAPGLRGRSGRRRGRRGDDVAHLPQERVADAIRVAAHGAQPAQLPPGPPGRLRPLRGGALHGAGGRGPVADALRVPRDHDAGAHPRLQPHGGHQLRGGDLRARGREHHAGGVLRHQRVGGRVHHHGPGHRRRRILAQGPHLHRLAVPAQRGRDDRLVASDGGPAERVPGHPAPHRLPGPAEHAREVRALHRRRHRPGDQGGELHQRLVVPVGAAADPGGRALGPLPLAERRGVPGVQGRAGGGRAVPEARGDPGAVHDPDGEGELRQRALHAHQGAQLGSGPHP
mmetsp:Transcript_4405/g.13003  ORF Transcript_4405/g.13003 Transcript_4405/m.13003 type:complete len:398 (-) Transcript_4405:1194-2387(-)